MKTIGLHRKIYYTWLIAITLSLLPFTGFSQLPDITISLNLKNKTTAKALEVISFQTGYYFTFNSDLLSGYEKISLKLNEVPLKTALDSLFKNPDLNYQLIDKNIVIYRKSIASTAEQETREDTAPLRIEGKIRDRQTGEELPFVTIMIHGTNKGIISNEQGEFTLMIPEKMEDPILVVSMIGYKNNYTHINRNKTEDILIELEKDVISLQEVIIRYQNPDEVVKELINNISNNYLDEPSSMDAYFREYVQKSKEFLTFSEAVIDIAKSPYTISLKSDNVRIIKGRKLQNITTEDSIVMKIQSGVKSSLQLDIVKIRPDFLLNDFDKYYDLEFRNIVSYRNQQVYLIGFKPREGIPYALYSGELYVNTNDLALVAADFSISPEELRKNPERFLVKKSPYIKIRPQKASYRVEYRKKDQKYHISMVQAEVSFRIRKKRQWFSSLYNIGIEMAITEVETGIRENIPRKERLKPNAIFSDQQFSYDPSFWGDYNIIQPEASLREALRRMGYEWENMGE